MMDRRKKRVLVVLSLGSVLLVWRLCAFVGPVPAPAQGSAAPPTEPMESVAPTGPDPQADVWRSQDALAARPWGRDPFTPVGSQLSGSATDVPRLVEPPRPAPTAPRVRFSGVCEVEGARRAIVNGSIVAEGDVVSGDFRVVAITPHRVTLGSGNWEFDYALGADQPTARSKGNTP